MTRIEMKRLLKKYNRSNWKIRVYKTEDALISATWHYFKFFDPIDLKNLQGVTHHSSRTILLLKEDPNVMKETFLHELAHALNLPHEGHGWNWLRTAEKLGCVELERYWRRVSEFDLIRF